MSLSAEKLKIFFQISVVILLPISLADEVPYIHFQVDEIPTIFSWAKFNGTLPSLESFSFCFHFKVMRVRTSYDTIISYDTATSTNELYLGYSATRISYEFWHEYAMPYKSNFTFNALQWVRSCFVQDVTKKVMKMWINDAEEEKFTDDLVYVEGGGMLYLGQDQDSMGGGFTKDQSLNAYVVDFHIFEEAISDKEARDFVSCRKNFRLTPLIDFYNFENDWILNGSVETGMISEDAICFEDTSVHIMFPPLRNFYDSLQFCHNLGGELPVPQNNEENSKLKPIIKKYKDVCIDNSGTTNWLAIKIDVVNKTYLNYYTGNELDYANFNQQLFFKNRLCGSILAVDAFFGEWFADFCYKEPKCTLCEFNRASLIQTRGPCYTSMYNAKYLIYDDYMMKPRFRGYHYSDLKWNGSTWVLTDFLLQKDVALMKIHTNHDYPIGIKEWEILSNSCFEGEERSMYIVFSTCKHNEYTCDDGTCINIEYRCDQLLHCPDNSDEINCQIIKVPPTYIKILPPPEEDRSSVEVKIDMIVTSISSFSLSDLTLSYDITINFEWRDARLTYQNLRVILDQNQVRQENTDQIWVPTFYLEDESGSKVTIIDHGSRMFIERNSDPLPDDRKNLKEDRLYEGKDNSIILKRILTLRFLCQFDLSYYPFDVQSCKLVLRSAQGSKSVRMIAGKAEFLGERRLLEYQVNEIFLDAADVSGFSELSFVITFFNLYKYYIFGTYVPTSLIVFITYMTFFYALEDFTNRIMVSLTALMVLAALFLQTNQGVARTAYMKIIDIWFLYCMVFNFFIILAQVTLNYIRNNYHFSTSISPVTFVNSNVKKIAFQIEENKKSFNYKTFLNPINLNNIFRIFFPCSFTCLTIAYILYVFTNWRIPEM